MTATAPRPATAWRGYRWPLRDAAHRASERADAPAWHWLVVTALLAVTFGIIDLNEVVSADFGPVHVHGNDLIFLAVALLAGLQYAGGRRRPVLLRCGARLPIFAMALLFGVAAMMGMRDYQETAGGSGNLQVFVRVLPYYGVFFAVAAFISTRNDLRNLLRLWFAITALGTVIVILQSLRGPGDLFGGGLIDDMLVDPGPQIVDRYGIFYRSNFPIYFAAVWCCFCCASLFALRPAPLYLAGALFFSAAFILNMSRGLYFGVALAGVVFLVLMSATRRMRVRLAVAAACGVTAVIVLIPYVGLGGLDQAVIGRTGSGLSDYRLGAGTWEGRLEQVDLYRSLEPQGSELMLGYGYGGQRSGLHLPFIEFGPVDLLYRAGVVGTAALGVAVVIVLWFTVGAVRRWRHEIAVAAAATTICSIVSELGGMPSYDHFLYVYYAAVLGAGVAVTVTAGALDRAGE